MAEFENIKTIEYTNRNWHLVRPFADPTTLLTVKNRGAKSVSVFCTKANITAAEVQVYLDTHAIDPPEIGGLFYEISSKTDEKMFVRCNEGQGIISVRIYGTVDPMEDLGALGQIVSELIITHGAHEANKNNPHAVTKTQVKLGNIPNAISSDVDDPTWTAANDNQSLSTLRGLRQVRDYAKTHIKLTAHNPHGVTKDHVGLGKVANYPPATVAEALDTTNNNTYLTPSTGSQMVKDIVLIASSMKPQMVIQGQTVNRPSGWTHFDITSISDLVRKTGDRTIVINQGLQVSFAYRGMCRVSEILQTAMHGSYPSVMANGIHYLYIEMNEKGKFTNWGSSPYCPVTGAIIEAHDGDYYNYAQCTMQHANKTEVKRVYIAKVYFSSNTIIDVVNVPIGDLAIVPVTANIALGRMAIITNPFIAPVNTTALIEYDGKWGETEWNDQTGVKASPRPGYEKDQIAVQVGQVGYLTRGSSSGSAFGSDFVTVTAPLRLVVRVLRPH